VKIGLLGGTFDPVHCGHLIVAEEAADVMNLDQVIFIPARIPPHKLELEISSETHRMNMLSEAIGSSDKFSVSEIEFKRKGVSFTIETVKEMQIAYPDAEIFFIMGHDSFLEIETWYHYEELIEICKLIIVTRPGFESFQVTDFSESIRKYFPKKVISIMDSLNYDDRILSSDWKICLLMIAGLKVSASEIRLRIKNGRSIRYLVPDTVRDYILAQSLYTDKHGDL